MKEADAYMRRNNSQYGQISFSTDQLNSGKAILIGDNYYCNPDSLYEFVELIHTTRLSHVTC